ncbi:MAG: MBL fold metallo-hydrolase [Victivallaceae bacterium]|nr:MBL fold metallo-hydrolase [Victivallaceae bacterium]
MMIISCSRIKFILLWAIVSGVFCSFASELPLVPASAWRSHDPMNKGFNHRLVSNERNHLIWRFSPKSGQSFNDLRFSCSIAEPVDYEITLCNPGDSSMFGIKCIDNDGIEWISERIRLPEKRNTPQTFLLRHRMFENPSWADVTATKMAFPVKKLYLLSSQLNPGKEYVLDVSSLRMKKPEPSPVQSENKLYGMFEGEKVYFLAGEGRRQMLSSILVSQKGKVVVVDGGNSCDAPELEKRLVELGGTVDCWMITHAHDDHFSALQRLAMQKKNPLKIRTLALAFPPEKMVATYEPKALGAFRRFMSAVEKLKKDGTQVQLLRTGDLLHWDTLHCKVLYSYEPEFTHNLLNNSSLVLRFEISNQRLLYLGDLGRQPGEKLRKENASELSADIVQMAHHGQGAVSEAFYQKVSPRVAIYPATVHLWDNFLPGKKAGSGPYPQMAESRKWMKQIGNGKMILLVTTQNILLL